MNKSIIMAMAAVSLVWNAHAGIGASSDESENFVNVSVRVTKLGMSGFIPMQSQIVVHQSYTYPNDLPATPMGARVPMEFQRIHSSQPQILVSRERDVLRFDLVDKSLGQHNSAWVNLSQLSGTGSSAMMVGNYKVEYRVDRQELK